VAGRLVEGETGLGFLLDQQEFAVALDDGGDGDIGFPDHGARRQSVILPADFG
jgi:hypothetical protein